MDNNNRNILVFLLSKRYIVKKHLISIILFFLIGIGLGFYKKLTVEKIYASEFTIMTENSGGGGIGKYLRLASLMGMGGSSGSAMSPENMTDLLKSKRIVYETLFSKKVIGGKEKLIINYYLEEFEPTENFLEKHNLTEFKFHTNNLDSLSNLEANYANSIYKKLVKEELLVNIPKNSVLINGDVVSESALFAEVFAKTWVSTLEKYLSDNILNEEKKSVLLLENKRDSITTVLLKKEAFFANKIDNSVFIRKSQGRIEQLELQREIELLNLMYATTIQQLEMAKISLDNGKRVFQVVDKPSLAFQVKNGVSIIVIGFLGIVMAIGRLTYLIYKESIVEQLNELNTDN